MRIALQVRTIGCSLDLKPPAFVACAPRRWQVAAAMKDSHDLFIRTFHQLKPRIILPLKLASYPCFVRGLGMRLS